MTPGDFAILAAAEKLAADGNHEFPGVFHAGDIASQPAGLAA